jgi:hypothetical protein
MASTARVFAMLIALMLLPGAADATILVGLRAEDQLVFGSDSRVIGPGGTSPRPDTCKIHQGRRCFFALSGPVTGPAYDAIAIARAACAAGRDIDAIVDGFMSQVEQPYKTAHEWALQHERESVLKRVPLSLGIFVIGWRGAALTMLHTGYWAKPSVFERIGRIEVKNGDFIQIGVRELARFQALNPYWFQPPYARAAERLVEAGMASGWVDVGPPVAVLQVDATGARWFKQGLCPAIDPTLWSTN